MWWIIPVVILAIIAFKFVFFARFGWWGGRWGHDLADPDAILKRRLASGDIGESEYARLRDLVRK
jgi:uncharacterized membrane protein